jgi:predicted small lipoprotein YifL
MGIARCATAFILVLLGLSLAGCGQKGPLKLPNKPASHIDTIHFIRI